MQLLGFFLYGVSTALLEGKSLVADNDFTSEILIKGAMPVLLKDSGIAAPFTIQVHSFLTLDYPLNDISGRLPS